MEYPELPLEIHNYCTVVSLDQDYGPISKILGGLIAESDPETIIISFDDDVIYDNNLVHELLRSSKVYPNNAIGANGLYIKGNILTYTLLSYHNEINNPLIIKPKNKATCKVDILFGYSGVLYYRKFFPKDIHDLVKYIYDDFNSLMMML